MTAAGRLCDRFLPPPLGEVPPEGAERAKVGGRRDVGSEKQQNVGGREAASPGDDTPGTKTVVLVFARFSC